MSKIAKLLQLYLYYEVKWDKDGTKPKRQTHSDSIQHDVLHSALIDQIRLTEEEEEKQGV